MKKYMQLSEVQLYPARLTPHSVGIYLLQDS